MNAPNKECLWSFSTPPSSCSGSERCVSSGASKGFSRQGRTKPIAGQRHGLRAGVKVWDGGERTSSSVVPSTPPTKLHLFFPFRWEGLNISLELLFFFFLRVSVGDIPACPVYQQPILSFSFAFYWAVRETGGPA